MRGHAVVRLRELEDQAVRGGLSPNVEFRLARAALGLEQSGISYQRLAPDFRVPFGHRHARQEEVYVLVSGSARAKLDDEIVELEPWTLVRVANETMRCFEAGPEGAEFLIVGAPATPPGDAEVVPGWWE